MVQREPIDPDRVELVLVLVIRERRPRNVHHPGKPLDVSTRQFLTGCEDVSYGRAVG
jgi:hypothetical protein